jgi:hypothetical protein
LVLCSGGLRQERGIARTLLKAEGRQNFFSCWSHFVHLNPLPAEVLNNDVVSKIGNSFNCTCNNKNDVVWGYNDSMPHNFLKKITFLQLIKVFWSFSFVSSIVGKQLPTY